MAGVDALLGCLRLEQYRAALDDAVPCMPQYRVFTTAYTTAYTVLRHIFTTAILAVVNSCSKYSRSGIAACYLITTRTMMRTMSMRAGLRRRLVRRGAHERSAARRARCSRQHGAMWKAAARRLRPIRPPARPASARSSSGRPQFPASLGELADAFWLELADHTGLLYLGPVYSRRHEAWPRGKAQVGSAALPRWRHHCLLTLE